MKRIAITALLVATSVASQAQTYDFSGLDAAHAAVPNGYAGVTWSNFYVLDGSAPGLAGSGYDHGRVTSNEVAYNPFGNPASIVSTTADGFSLSDAYFTGAWNNGLTITASAVFENGTTASTSFVVDTSGPVDQFFNWAGLSQVTFTSSGGTQAPGVNGSGEHFAMDNITFAPAVPEPANDALMLAGLGALGLVARRRRAR